MELYITGCLLGICTVTDLQRRKICTGVLFVWGVAGCTLVLLRADWLWTDALWGSLTGVLVLLIGKCTGEAVGYGDGLLLIVTGIYLGGWRNLELLFGGLLLAAVCSVVLLISGKATRKTKLPFVPFLLLSFLGMVLL